jgi:histidinol phosphatase-like PHP family hydrolase
MRILALSDLHYSDLSRAANISRNDCGVLSRTLLKKAVLRLDYMNLKPDLIVLTGDILACDEHPSAALDLIAIKGELTRSGIPYLILPGNHDIGAPEFNRVMSSQSGLHIINGYGFVIFNDQFEKHPQRDSCFRASQEIELPRRIAVEHPELPLIALQHAPIYPAIDADYPYNPGNSHAIIDSYQQSNVILSLSGHYHPGTQPVSHKNTIYYTIPALSDSPHPFALIELEGGSANIREFKLRMDEDYIIDSHCHTEHAYCGTTTDTAKCVALSKALNISQICITEHAFQLYFPKKTAMSFIWQSQPELVREVWQSADRGRMRSYLDYVTAFRSPYVRAGLELDLYDGGQLLLAPEDIEFGWDLFVGAVHFIEGFKRGSIDQHSAEKLFMRDLQKLLERGVHVIAHPFRFFGRNQLATPRHLYQPVAELLAHYSAAAEINYHTHAPDPDFFRICVEQGVKLALGSDTHDLCEAGEFYPHLNLMRRAGISPEDFQRHLFKPDDIYEKLQLKNNGAP